MAGSRKAVETFTALHCNDNALSKDVIIKELRNFEKGNCEMAGIEASDRASQESEMSPKNASAIFCSRNQFWRSQGSSSKLPLALVPRDQQEQAEPDFGAQRERRVIRVGGFGGSHRSRRRVAISVLRLQGRYVIVLWADSDPALERRERLWVHWPRQRRRRVKSLPKSPFLEHPWS